MNLETANLQDCLDNYNFKSQCATLNDGKLIGFQQEEIPTQTANPSGDEQPDKATAMTILRHNKSNVNNFKEDFIMEYIYRMSRKMYWETIKDAHDCHMLITQYVTERFGLRGTCIKVEIA